MTPEATADLVRRIALDLPGVEEPERLLRALEERAERRPTDRQVAAALFAVHGLATAGDGVPAVVAGVRRETLVRWDAWTGTWDGPDLTTGAPARVRALRAAASRDPVMRRALARDGRAVQAGLGDLAVTLEESPWPALRTLLPGTVLSPRAEADERTRSEVLAKRLGSAVADLARFERLHLALPALSPREILDTGTGLRIVCLTPEEPAEAGPSLTRIAETLGRWWGEGDEGPVEALLDGLATLPPRTAAEAALQIRGMLAEDLAATRHRLRTRARGLSRRDRQARLLDAVLRLGDAVPPPDGRGPVGVDLDGRITMVESAGGRIGFGPPEDAVVVRELDGEIEVREARRLLRAHAAAPPNPRFVDAIGGSDADAERICRWVAAALQLRTIERLLSLSGAQLR